MATLRFDKIGWACTAVFIVWNMALLAALTFLWIHRQLPSLRMRRLPLLIPAIILLHLYGAICVLCYPIGALIPCTAEFWVMSIYLPFGFAMFQASNSQFLHLASRQKQFVYMTSLKDHKPMDESESRVVAKSRWKRVFAGVERADMIDRTLIFIGVGMAAQLALTLFIFLGSAKFHSEFGLFDYTVQGTGMEVRVRCSKGWEWWLSIVWQLFWTWVYAPYMLWKSRGVKDVHGWRTQTICCCLAGLPASPLWLTGLYAPQMASVNKYFPPPVWFSVCIFLMEIFTIGFPIVGVLKGHSLRQETLDAIANWEIRQADNVLEGSPKFDAIQKEPSMSSTSTTLKSIGGHSQHSQRSDMLTMTAMENALRTNALPLLEFAALKDFSGENVSFLTHVADWRRFWFTPKASTIDHRRNQFLCAVRIYAHFISLQFSEFPINISSKEMKQLHIMFEPAAVLFFRRNRGSIDSALSDTATPFDQIQPAGTSEVPVDDKSMADPITETKSNVNLDALGRANLRAVSRMQIHYIEEALADVEIPNQFSELVFDAAEKEIKYLVLTNTWPKFVSVGCANSRLSNEADEEGGDTWFRKLTCS